MRDTHHTHLKLINVANSRHYQLHLHDRDYSHWQSRTAIAVCEFNIRVLQTGTAQYYSQAR